MIPEIPAVHSPVLLKEALEGLAIKPDGIYIDCTFGRGGHSREILAKLGPSGFLLAMDKDPSAVASEPARELGEDARFTIVHGSFADLEECVSRRNAIGRVAGVLMDLGVSSPQLDEAQRGFSFMRDGPLDMRMDSSRGLTAAQWLMEVSEAELAMVLRDFGEERFARRIAKAITEARPIFGTRELAELISRAVPTREKGRHPATRSFQAIRIAVNHELEELQRALKQAVKVLAPGGRLVVIAFHSLEDRIVKRFMRFEERGQPTASLLPVVTEHRANLRRIGKAVMPGDDEVRANVRSRSAVLRIAERVAA